MTAMGVNTQDLFINKTKKDEKQKQQMKTIMLMIHQPEMGQKTHFSRTKLLVSWSFIAFNKGKVDGGMKNIHEAPDRKIL